MQLALPFALLLALAAAAPQAAQGEVVLVWAVTRHGARNVLPKNATLGEDEATGGPTLLPQGINGSRAAGAAFRDRYLAHPSCALTKTCLSLPGAEIYGLVNTAGVGFSNYDTLVRSSSLDRTIKSAAAFLSGAFPTAAPAPAAAASGAAGVQAVSQSFVSQLPPIYTVADTEDWTVRAYTKCSAYQDRLLQWFQSDEFTAKEAETKATREAVGARAPNLDVSLTNWWNVFDAFNVWRKYGVGDAMPDIPATQFKQVSAIAEWLETAKMRSNLTGNGLGGPLLGDIIARLQAAADAVTAGDRAHFYRLLLTSGHYNTQLGLLAAMALDTALTPVQLPWLATLPATSAVLAFELHHGPWNGSATGHLLAVRLVFQNGPNAEYQAVPLPQCSTGGAAASDTAAAAAAEALAGPGACELSAFSRAYGGAGIDKLGAWCEACRNNQTNGCVAYRARQGGANGAAAVQGAGGAGGGEAWKIAVSVVASVAGTAALAAAAFALFLRKERSKRRPMHSAPLVGDEKPGAFANTL